MSDQNNLDPGGWMHLFAGGIIMAAAKWAWGRLVRSPRPLRETHSNAYVVAELRQMRESIDDLAGTVSGMTDRIARLEARRSHSGD